MHYQLFGDLPSAEVVGRVLAAFGLSGLRDSRPFTRADVAQLGVGPKLEAIDELRLLYVPCKAIIYLQPPLSVSRCLTILRHMLRTVSARLVSREAYHGGTKFLVYRVTVPDEGGHPTGSAVRLRRSGCSVNMT